MTPIAPPHPCSYPGCGALTTGSSRCDAHTNTRPTAAQRGYGAAWRRKRRRHLMIEPLCRTCKAQGRVTEANTVDHITPHRGDMRLFWDRENWQALCKPCHDRKTATEDGRWGRRGPSV